MARSTRLYFATDLHGSEKCFRKFVNAASVYRPDVMVLGGDLAGKAIQGITRLTGGRYHCTFRGTSYDVEAGPELDGLERMIADHGYYTFSGSLTTPPCSEDVTWFVLKKPVEISKPEEAAFATKYAHNARPVQPLHGRAVQATRQ